MLIFDLLQTDINMITLTPDLTLRSDLLMLIYDLLHTDIKTILKTDTSSNTET